MKWKEYLIFSKTRREFIFTIILLAVTLLSLTNFLNYVENRPGVVLPDPLLSMFNPINLTWLTFGLIYFSLIAAVVTFSRKPELIVTAIQVYTVMVIFRIAAMYLVPFNPPAKMISLDDPFVQFFGTGQTLTKDLFFSGHTATLFLLFLTAEKEKLKYLFLFFTVIVGAAVLLQHVHYSIDVFAAPFFTYAAYRTVKLLRKKFAYENGLKEISV